VDVSEGPEEPAVEGRASTEGDCEGRASRRVLRFRVLAISGHTHCNIRLSRQKKPTQEAFHLAVTTSTARAVGFFLVAL
jgi:hypothetical protein